ncbi:MAG TPA: hypothetical protein VFA70_01985, partial [Dehalococcoidia bacterium]|nr:hypothetical protein [Dehalococcoidia bacterium]
AAPEAPSHAVSHGIGTGFGARSGHQVVEARFEREEAPAAVLVLRYDDAAGLQARGIQVLRYNDADRVARANPFPADRGAPPPPGWRG